MTITVEAYTGSATMGSTEWSMTTNTSGPDADTSSGLFQAFVDMNALDAGDIFEFRVYEKCRTGDVQRTVYSARFANAQAAPVWAAPALILGVGWDMTLKKISGVDRAIAWRISKAA
jgi:hypothetical protein